MMKVGISRAAFSSLEIEFFLSSCSHDNLLILTIQCFETAVEVLLEKQITGMPVVRNLVW